MKSGNGITTKKIKTGFHDKSDTPFVWISPKTKNKTIYLDNPKEMRVLANWLIVSASKIEKKMKEKK